MALGLAPDEVGCDVSNTRRHGVLTELRFQTALQSMKFRIGFAIKIPC